MSTNNMSEDENEKKPNSNWVPVADPNLSDVLAVSGRIVIIGVAILCVLLLLSAGDVMKQVQSGDWDTVEGTVVEASDDMACFNDSGEAFDCTTVKIAYTYEERNYTTTVYSMLSDDWLNGQEYWLEQETVTIYVNPEQPAEALYLPGWGGVIEEMYTGFFFMGIILAGYIGVFVPVWFVYAKIQRLNGIEAPQKETDLPDAMDDDTAGDASEDAPSVDEETPEEEKFW